MQRSFSLFHHGRLTLAPSFHQVSSDFWVSIFTSPLQPGSSTLQAEALCAGFIYKQASSVPHAAGRVPASTWRSHKEFNNATMGSTVTTKNKTKLSVLCCVSKSRNSSNWRRINLLVLWPWAETPPIWRWHNVEAVRRVNLELCISRGLCYLTAMMPSNVSRQVRKQRADHMTCYCTWQKTMSSIFI